MDMMEILKVFGPTLGLGVAFIYSWGRISSKVDDIIARQDRFEGQILEELRDLKHIMAACQLACTQRREK